MGRRRARAAGVEDEGFCCPAMMVERREVPGANSRAMGLWMGIEL
jgi:hypothetical protein